jgi:hypothetical protein
MASELRVVPEDASVGGGYAGWWLAYDDFNTADWQADAPNDVVAWTARYVARMGKQPLTRDEVLLNAHEHAKRAVVLWRIEQDAKLTPRQRARLATNPPTASDLAFDSRQVYRSAFTDAWYCLWQVNPEASSVTSKGVHRVARALLWWCDDAMVPRAADGVRPIDAESSSYESFLVDALETCVYDKNTSHMGQPDHEFVPEAAQLVVTRVPDHRALNDAMRSIRANRGAWVAPLVAWLEGFLSAPRARAQAFTGLASSDVYNLIRERHARYGGADVANRITAYAVGNDTRLTGRIPHARDWPADRRDFRMVRLGGEDMRYARAPPLTSATDRRPDADDYAAAAKRQHK